MLTGFVPWPPEVARRYRDGGYWRGDTLAGTLRAVAGEHGGRTALVCGDDRFTYAELDARVDRLAAGLRELGLVAPDRVLVQLPNTAEFVVLLFALARLGVIPVLALPNHREGELGYLCELSGARAYLAATHGGGPDPATTGAWLRVRCPNLRHVIVVGPGAAASAPGVVAFRDVDAEPVALAGPDPEEVALLLLSGGSTGLPKLIPRTHDDYAYNIRASAQVCGFDESTVYLAALPVGHNFPLGCPGILGALGVGGTVVLAPDPSPPETFPLIEAERVTATALVPTLADLWAQASAWVPADLSSLRLLQVGGAKLHEERARHIDKVFNGALQQVFGMAEGLLNYTRAGDPSDVVAQTQGRPLSPADELLVVGPDGAEVPAGEVGELLTRGPYTIRGYYLAPEHNDQSFTTDGFYRTGDLVQRRDDGYLVVSGRVKEQINRAGEKIAPVEVEAHLLEHPALSSVAVVGIPDPVLGERICAFILTRDAADDLTVASLRQFLADRGLAAHKFPESLRAVDSWPLTSVGKVDKRALAAQAHGDAANLTIPTA
jgi:2,3-dihydroxybenzoate-AMP ligase